MHWRQSRELLIDRRFIQKIKRELTRLLKDVNKLDGDVRKAPTWLNTIDVWADRYYDLIRQIAWKLEERVDQDGPDAEEAKRLLQKFFDAEHIYQVLEQQPSMEGDWDQFMDKVRAWLDEAYEALPMALDYLDKVCAFFQKNRIKIDDLRVTWTRMGGFRVGFRGRPDMDKLAQFKEGLAHYRKRAQRVYPWLLRYHLPIVLDWTDPTTYLEAYYDGELIVVPSSGILSNPMRMAWTLAHEMGHHIWRAYLSAKAKKDWSDFINGDYKRLDLSKVVDQIKPNEDLEDFIQRIQSSDPILALQLETLFYNNKYTKYNINNPGTLRWLAGVNEVIKVPARPISGYAAESPEEAFCEAFGKLVAYGPKTLPRDIVKFIRALLPGIRVARVATYKQAKRFTLDERYIQKLRKDLLVLLRNIKRLGGDEKKIATWRAAVSRWTQGLEVLGAELRRELNRRAARGGPDSKDAKSLLHLMDSFWDLHAEMVDFPIDGRLGWDLYEEDLRKWANRVRRKARDAWRYLDMVHAYMREGPVQVEDRDTEWTRLAGFRVGFIGTPDPKVLSKLEAGLAFYRKRASRVYPWLLRYHLPIVLDSTEDSLAQAGRYDGRRVVLTRFGVEENPKRTAWMVAHEMGHHIWRTYLSGAARKDWSDFIYGDYKDLDLRAVVDDIAKPGESLLDLTKRLREPDPVLAIQLQSLIHDSAYGFRSMDEIRDYLDRGGNPTIKVPANPISGYAAKNPEEAFCEAFGKLVAYGPRSLPPVVVRFLRALLPGLKVASKRLA